MADHFVVEGLAKRLVRRGDIVGVGVLGFEVGGDFGVLALAQPGVVVGEGVGVDCRFHRMNWRDGRSRLGVRGHAFRIKGLRVQRRVLRAIAFAIRA